MESRNSSPTDGLPPQSFDHETSYRNVIDVQFVSRALAGGARCVRGSRWATRTLYPADAPGVIASAYYNYNRSFEALATVEEARAPIIRQGDTMTVRLAAESQEALNGAEREVPHSFRNPPWIRTRSPSSSQTGASRGGAFVTTRALTVPALSEIELNYPRRVRSELSHLTEDFRPGAGERLLLWHGLPGCGKTWALRALASEWRNWCRFRYVSDPERLLNEPAYLVELIHTRPGLADDGSDWRLIVLEDTGQLLAADAKQQAGQGLSRLLNVVDGLLGESSQTLFLVTTNEDLRAVHPAVARPGRCAQLLEFGALPIDEANDWLAANGAEERVATPATLAELFAVRDGVDLAPTRRRQIGFAASDG